MKLFIVIVILLCIFTAPASLFASSLNEIKPTAPKEPIVVNGDNVEYFQEKKMVTGSGNISIKYKDIYLTCDKITVYLDTREAIAEGSVRVTQKGAYFTGERMNYNFDTKKGTVWKGYLNAKPFYGKAEEVNKIENKDQFKLNEGYITTCDLAKPHYRVRAKQVEVYLDDKIVARHIVMYVGNVPILYFPYYVQPLKEKKSHITVIPGNRKEWGYYALTSYRYYVDDRNKGDILLDYRAKKGLAEGINHYYMTKDIGRGAVKLYFTRENAFTYQPFGKLVKTYHETMTGLNVEETRDLLGREVGKKTSITVTVDKNPQTIDLWEFESDFQDDKENYIYAIVPAVTKWYLASRKDKPYLTITFPEEKPAGEFFGPIAELPQDIKDGWKDNHITLSDATPLQLAIETTSEGVTSYVYRAKRDFFSRK